MDFSPNQNALRLCAAAVANAVDLGIELVYEDNNLGLIDFGVQVDGSLEAGQLLARICLSDLGTVELGNFSSPPLQNVAVETGQPLWACMGSQYAGWQIQHPGFFGMGSGPVRLRRGSEKVLLEYALREETDEAVLVLESRALPSHEILTQLREGFSPDLRRLIVCVAPTQSIAGTLQIVARSVESVCHKLHELKFDLRAIQRGRGVAPLLLTSPEEPEAEMLAMGRCNDAILLGGAVVLQVDCADALIEQIGPRAPSCASPQFGVPFAQLLRDVHGDFYRLDPLLFAPACIEFQNHRSGNTFRYGELRWDLLPDLST